MKNITKIVEELIEDQPFLQEALAKQIINHAALAQSLIPQIENITKQQVKFSAVNMAIRRLSEKITNQLTSEYKFTQQTDILLRSNLVEITINKSNTAQKTIQTIYNSINYNKGDFLTITVGINEIMIITNRKLLEKITNIIKEENIKKTITNLSSLTINIPQESCETIGLFYIITRALNWNNINITDIVSTLTEMTFIIKETDAPKAFNTITKTIKKNTNKKDLQIL